MAIKTFYATSSLVSVHQEMSETVPGSNVFLSPVTGWVVATAITNRSKLNSQVEATVFDSATYPNAGIDTTNGDCFRSTNTYTGTFAAGNWSFRLPVAYNTAAAGQGRAYFRLYRGTNVAGTGATQITSSALTGGTVNLAAGAANAQNSTYTTFNPGAVSLTAEYLFVQVAWERTVAGSMSTSDVNIVTGGVSTPVLSVLETPDFTASAPTIVGDLTKTLGAATLSATAAVAVAADLSKTLGTIGISSTGTGIFNPSSITGLKAWFKAETLALSDNTPVGTWTDQSGNGNDATQTGSARPLLSTTTFAINGHQVVFFNISPANQYLNLTSGIDGNTWSVIVVMQPYGGGYPMTSISSSGGGNGCPLGPFFSSGGTLLFGRQDYYGSDGTPGTAAHVFTVTSQSAVSLLAYVDGVSQSVSGITPSGTTTDFNVIGMRGAGLDYSIGGIAELLVYDSILSSIDRGNLETYLITKYAIGSTTASLSVTLGAATLSSAATHPDLCDLSKTFGVATLVSAAGAAVKADLSKTLGAATLASVAVAAVKADLSKTLGDATLVSTGTVAAVGLTADLSKTLDAATVSSAGVAAVKADASKTLGALTSTSDGSIPVAADLSQTLGVLTSSSSGTVAAAGDVSIDGAISTTTAHSYRALVFTTSLIGYSFYTDSDSTWGYSKTTDGGATWGAYVQIKSLTVVCASDVWYDRWTPGDSGTLIHIITVDTTSDDVTYIPFDTATDTVTFAPTVIFAGLSAIASNGTSIGITKARSGYLYCCYNIDGGTEFGFKRSTDAGANWSADLGGTFNEGDTDHFWLFPASNTGDNNDIWALYHDSSGLAATIKMWDSSAAAQVESSTVHAIVAPGGDITVYQYPASGSVRHSDGDLFCVGWTSRDLATSDLVSFDVSAVNSGSLTGITTKTEINTNIDDTYHPSVFIDQSNYHIYVAYNGKRDGSETLGTATKVYYTKSTDGGTSWSAGDTAYMVGTAALVVQTWAPLMGPRFYVGWRVGTTLVGNAVNSIDTSGPAGVTADLSKTLGAATVASAGTVAVVADLSKTLGAATLSSTTVVSVKSDLSKTLGSVTLVSAGTVGGAPLTADLSRTLGAATVSSSAAAAVVADLSKTLSALTSSSAGVAPVAATLAKTLGSVTFTSAGTAAVLADLSKTLGGLTLVSAGTVISGRVANLNVTLGAATAASIGTTPVVASSSVTLGALTSTATATHPDLATLSKTLGALTLVGQSGSPAVIAALDKTLGAATCVSTAKATAGADVSKQLGSLTVSSTGKAAVVANTAKTLGVLVVSATGGQAIIATADITLGELLLSSQAGAAIQFANLALNLGSPTVLTSQFGTGEAIGLSQSSTATSDSFQTGEATELFQSSSATSAIQ